MSTVTELSETQLLIVDQLLMLGWFPVRREFVYGEDLSYFLAVDYMKKWCNNQGMTNLDSYRVFMRQYIGGGVNKITYNWLFKHKKDAIIFALKWA